MKKLLTVLMFITIFMVGITTSILSKDYSTYPTNTLVSPEIANKIIETKKDLIILDIREQKYFENGHVEGSYQIWEPDLSVDKVIKILESYIITPNTHIFLLSDNANYKAIRLWWILDMYRYKNISVIDGGIDNWISTGLKVTKGKGTKATVQTTYKFTNSIDLSKLAKLEDVKTAIAKNLVILDTRAYLESDGLIPNDRGLPKGKIPGSYNIPWDIMVNKDKTFKSFDEIKRIFDKENITGDRPIILYSNSGTGSAYMTFVLKELLGYKDVKNYDGSWSEWVYESNHGDVKIEKENIFKVLFSYLTKREKLESVITLLGVWGPLAFILIYIFITITILPAIPITVAGGIIFGPVMGVVYTAMGAGLGLSFSFLIARYIARESIEKKFGNTPIFKKIDQGVRKDGWFILAITRLIPIFPFGIQNYVYGLTSIGFFKYMILSIIFVLPGSSVYVMLAGAFTSGDKAIVLKYSITASLIFFGLMLITRIIKKKIGFQN